MRARRRRAGQDVVDEHGAAGVRAGGCVPGAVPARPTPRDIRHELFAALGLGGQPPTKPIEFDLPEPTITALTCTPAQPAPAAEPNPEAVDLDDLV